MRIVGRIGAFVVLFILLAWVVFLLGYYGKVELLKLKVERNTAHFLKAVKQQRFDEAVSLFGEPLDLKSLQNIHPMRLVKYSGIKAVFDDGCVCSGHAQLTFQADGPSVTVDAVFALREGLRPGQICAGATKEQHEVLPQLAEWNKSMCGNDSF